MQDKDWYKKEQNEIYEILKTSHEGLTTKEVKHRLEKYGKNEIPKKKPDSFFLIMFKQLMDPIELLLVAAMGFSFMINEVIDGIAILFIIVVDLLMGTFQEWKANKNAEALSKLVEVKAKVLRDGKEVEVDSVDLVVGDIVLLESGTKISADLRIIESANLTIDESILTGESLSVAKNTDVITENAVLAERINMAYAGTSVLTGRAKAVVVETAINTEIGKIAGKVAETKDTKSPLTIRMEKFSKQISMLVVVVAIIIAILLYSKGTPGSEIFLSVIALSVSAMPEGLPLALTMALTIASNRMSKNNVIVKKLNSVESLGSCTVIASDKTGTLTVNQQTAKKIILPNGDMFNVSGTGYNDNGEVVPVDNANIEDARFIAELGAINNEAKLVKNKKKFEQFGDSMDIAFLALGMKVNADKEKYNIIDIIPYESENKYSAVYYEQNGETHCTTKGSLEKILSFCTDMKVGDKYEKLDKDLIQKQNDELARDGYRVIALAEGEAPYYDKENKEEIKKQHFIGLVAFIDPIREEAKQSIAECKTVGIKVVMITGDHPLTAFSIAKELGIVESMDEVATSVEVDEYLAKGHKAFDKYIKNKKVFTRVTPINKLEIVESYKRQGEFVAVTGDGVNDAPAIKAANIGIAMGSGTDVAKETASMIVLDDNFKSIVLGIKEGRNAYSNIRKVSYMLLSCGVAEVLFFCLSILFDLPMPLVAIQLLWLNIVTDGLQDFALSFEKAEKGIMKEAPRSTKESIFNKDLLSEVLTAGLSIGLIVFAVWVFLLNNGMTAEAARGYIMVLMVFMQNMHVLNCRSEKNSVFKVPLKTNPLIIFSIVSAIVLQIIVSEVPTLSKFLQTSSVPVPHMIVLFIVSTLIIIIMEVYKIIEKKILENKEAK